MLLHRRCGIAPPLKKVFDCKIIIQDVSGKCKGEFVKKVNSGIAIPFDIVYNKRAGLALRLRKSGGRAAAT
jgi:hypothetical protein